MKKYLIFWETDYCDNFPEKSGDCVIEARSEDEAIKIFYGLKIPKASIIEIQEERN